METHNQAIEPAIVSDIYADDIERVDICGPNVRMVFFTWQAGHKVVVAKIVRPIMSVQGRMMQIVAEARAQQAKLMQVALH